MLRACIQKVLPHHQKKYESTEDQSQKAAFWKDKIWPDFTTVKVSFLKPDPNEPQALFTSKMDDPTKFNIPENPDPLNDVIKTLTPEEAVKKVISERLQPLINLKFKFIDDPEGGDVRIAFNENSGSWSLVGTDCLSAKKGEATLNLGWIDVPTILHEFGHACGLIHEHQNPRGETIQWNKDKVYAWAKKTQGWDKEQVDTNIINTYSMNQINGSDFDPYSIMLYFFPAELTLDGKSVKQNTKLSKTDKKYLGLTYPLKGGDKKKQNNTILMVLIIISILVLLGVVFLLYKRRRRRRL